jgi:hypothetical protein
VIERDMVRRMILRGLVLAPVIVAALWLWRGQTYAWSGAVGLALTLGNLWLSARIIGGVAESSPQLLMPAALATFALGLLLLTAVALALQSADLVFFPVTGFVLIGSHLGLVLWEAAGAYGRIDSPTEQRPSRGNVGVRS